MRSGPLRNVIDIQRNTVTNARTGPTDSWATLASANDIRASIQPLVGREYTDAQAVNADVTTKIRVRAVSGITPKDRVAWGSRTFEIVSVITIDEIAHEMVLMCKELV